MLTNEDNQEIKIVNPFNFTAGLVNEAGIPLDFGDRPFMKEILEDMSPLQCILKAPQVGATVLQTIKAIWVAYYMHKDIIYTLPTVGDVVDMVGGKINRIIYQNPDLLSMIRDHDTIEQKQVGKNIIYYRGTFTTKQAMMVSAQLLIHDEVDASNREVLTQYETRLQATTGGMRWYFSHPSIVGAGIDAYWQKSDQKEWFIHCEFCDKWQFLEFPISINQEKQIYVCKFCQAEISDQQRRKGQWRKRFPNAEYSGYHISQLICPWIPATKIIKDFKEKEPQYFHNFVLALPYADAQSKITLETIKGLLTDENKRKGRVLIGVDTGVKIRFVVGDQNGLFDTGEVDNYEDLQRLCNKYGDTWVMVADAGGDIIGMRQFQENNQGRVFLCSFRQDKQSQNLIKWGEGDEFGRVACDRNRMIQLVVDEMNDKRIPLLGDLNKWWNFWLHCSHIFRTVEEDRLGNLVYVWQRSDRDDWFLAMVYYRIACDRFAQKESTFEGKEDNPKIQEAFIRDYKGRTGGIILTPPLVNKREDDYRYSGE